MCCGDTAVSTWGDPHFGAVQGLWTHQQAGSWGHAASSALAHVEEEITWGAEGGAEQPCPSPEPSTAVPTQPSSSCLPWMPKSCTSRCQHLGKLQAAPGAVGQMLGCSPACCGGPQPCLGEGSASLLPPQGIQGCLQHRLRRGPERGFCAPGVASPHPCAWALGLRV